MVVNTDSSNWQYKTLISHPKDTPAIWVYGISITPDNKKLVNAYGGAIFIWDLKTGELDHFIHEHSQCVLNLVISPNGKNIVTGSLDKTVKIWDLQTGELITTFIKRADPINYVALSYDGKIIACGGTNKYKSVGGKNTTVYLWNVETEELISTLTGHSQRINCIAFSPDNKIIVTGSSDKTIKVWDINKQQLLYTLTEDGPSIIDLLILPDCETLVSSGTGGIRFWSLETRQLLYTLSEDSYCVRSFAINHTYQIFVSDNSQEIRIWNLKTRELIHTLEFSNVVSITLSCDGKLLAAGNALGEVRVWEIPEDFLREIERDNKINSFIDNFDPDNLEKVKDRILVSILHRQGQSSFREKLMQIYNCQCVITGCNVEQVLEAAHITPYSVSNNNDLTNGLLLRADIHTLFDSHLLSINPDKMTIEISLNLKNTPYGDLAEKPILLPEDKDYKPNKQALEQHYQLFCEKYNCL